MKNILSYTDFIKEDADAGSSVGSGDAGGTAFATNSMNGMGNISSPQPSAIPGSVWSADATKGSGDISTNIGTYTKLPYNLIKKKKKRKKRV
jgi:hypothetical protein